MPVTHTEAPALWVFDWHFPGEQVSSGKRSGSTGFPGRKELLQPCVSVNKRLPCLLVDKVQQA